ncbi:MAG: response regulator transcription factor [Desertimonas sp.]
MTEVLVVEDEPDIAFGISVLLRRNGHGCTMAGDGETALRLLGQVRPDLVVLDIGLPVMDGWTLLRHIREVSDVPVLLLTAAGSEEDKVRGLRAGADDYLTKPFSNPELMARIEAILRRTHNPAQDRNEIVYGTMVVSPHAHSVSIDDRPVALSPQEFRLLTYLLAHRGQVLTTQQLLDEIWDDTTGEGGERVKFAMLRLRRKLGWGDADHSPLVAVRGLGYRLEASPIAG